MREVHGEIPLVEEEMHSDPDGEEEFLSPPKRPISVASNDDLTVKRKKTDGGMQRIPVQTNSIANEPRSCSTEPEHLARPLSREQMRYIEVAKQHQEDARYITTVVDRDENDLPSTPLIVDRDMPPPRRPLRRSMSRADMAVVQDLTPAMEDLLTPPPQRADTPRSPDRIGWMRELWSPGPEPIQDNESTHQRESSVPSHIRPNGPSHRSQFSFLPPGGNALGAKTPDLSGGEVVPSQPVYRHRGRLEHAPPPDSIEIKPMVRHHTLPIPVSVSEMPDLMEMHDIINASRPVEARDFYVHKRIDAIARASHTTPLSKDGTIRLGRYFSLTEEEVNETKEYLRCITGRDAPRPKTMIRLTCRPTNGEGSGAHAWPENTVIFLNGKSLFTTMVQTLITHTLSY
jgi:hypothetical protein